MNTGAIKKDLFDLFELDKMPPEESTKMLDRLAKLVFQAVLIRALPLLSEEDFAKYEKMLDDKVEADVLFNFLTEKVPEFQKIITEEAGVLRREAAAKMEEHKQ